MVHLVFDATQPLPERRFGLTFGRSRLEVRWQDRRELTFPELADLLRTAPVGLKDGPCYTPAVFTGSARRMDQTAEIHTIVLDADCGHSLEEICDAIGAKGWRAIVHSTHSHMTDKTAISAAPAEKWLTANPGGTIADYMIAKNGYLPRVMVGAEVVDEISEGAARNLMVRHSPCPKFRIILLLDRPWVATEYDTQQLANAKWRERIGALAHALGLHHDQSCVDTSRLFYLPRRRNEEQPFEHLLIEGECCDLWDLPDAAPPAAAPGLFDAPPRVTAGPRLQAVDPNHKTATTPDGEWIDLSVWAKKYAHRFEVVEALRARSPGIFSSRRSGVKHHLICPNSGSHITNGAEGTGTYAVNASHVHLAQLPSIQSGFVIHCMHNGCSGLDRLDHMRALLEAGTLSPDDIVAPAFLMPDIPQIDPSALVQSKAAARPADAAPVGGEDPGNITPSLYADLPGALGLMHAWVLGASHVPQPALALGSCLAFSAAAIGQRVQLQNWNVRPNIFVLGIAHSGAGKDWPIKAPKAMARAAGLTKELIGVEQVASDAGIISSVFAAPRQVMLIDEISGLLAATKDRASGQHMKEVPETLLKLYSASNTTYSTKSYADTDRVKVLDQPCVSLYGGCTPAGLQASLNARDITSGLLSRLVIFDAGDNDPLSRPPSVEGIPIGVVDWLIAWNRVSPIQNPVARHGGEPVIEPRVVMMTAEANEISEAFKIEMHAAKRAARPRGMDSLYVRTHENALKFALIRACAALPMHTDAGPAIDESLLCVDAATMRWAIELSRATVGRMDATASEIADGPFQQAMKALRQVMQRAGERGATMRDIARTTAGKHPKKMLDDLISALTSAGEAYWVAGIKTAGRPRDAYVHADFIRIHVPDIDKENPQ